MGILHERSRQFSQQSWFVLRVMFPTKRLFKLPVYSFPGGRPNSYAIGSSSEGSILPPDWINDVCFCFCIAGSEAEYPQDPSRHRVGFSLARLSVNQAQTFRESLWIEGLIELLAWLQVLEQIKFLREMIAIFFFFLNEGWDAVKHRPAMF